MNPEQYLDFMEGTNTLMDGMTSIRDGLIERNWEPLQASAAARELFSLILARSLQ